MEAIELKNVTKRYGGVTALDGVSLTLEAGKIYGLLGRNGAGKSTLLGVLSNRIFADGGTAFINGNPVGSSAAQDLLFCVGEANYYCPACRVKDLFFWAGKFYAGFDETLAEEIAGKFRLDVNRRFKSLSTGYRSICKLTLALALRIPYLVFDEPVLGLDANSRELFYTLLLGSYAKNGGTVVLATHLIEEVASLLEEVVLIDHGKILLQRSAESLRESGYCVAGPEQEVDRYCAGKHVVGEDRLGGLKLAYCLGGREPVPAGSPLQFSQMSLQKLFVKLTEREAENG